jgi:hypothetical protein
MVGYVIIVVLQIHVMQHIKEKRRSMNPLVCLNISVGYSHVDGESSRSEQSLDEEFGIPAIKTLGVRRANAANRTPRTDPGPCRSTKER